jgi:predicted PurR-regulated permease PerM
MSNSLNYAQESLTNEHGGVPLKDQGERNGQSAGEEIRNSTLLTIVKGFASMTPTFITQVMATIFMIYFFLVYGQLLLLRVLQSHSSFASKRLTIELLREVQKDLSNYILTITLVNLGLGLVVGTLFYFLGVEDAFLWGALAGVLNFAPYIGPLVSAFAFVVVSYIQFDSLAYAFGVSAMYLVANLIESQFVTPALLGRNLNLNPLVVFAWLLLWGWLWGGFGMLLGLPLLVCLCIYLEKTELVGDWYKVLRY